MTEQPIISTINTPRQGNASLTARRTLPEEVPVALVFDGTTLAVMMATPDDLEDFAVGFALCEGIISSVSEIQRCEIVKHDKGFEARMWLSEEKSEALTNRRRTLAGPVGCGLCGIESIEQAIRPLPSVFHLATSFREADVSMATAELARMQSLYERTSATHGAGFLLPGSGVTHVREDVGRHNALDKLIGRLALDKQDLGLGALVVTSRVSIELIQKCAMAGCAMLIAVSSPTGGAVELAKSCGITLIGFARNDRFDLFSHPHRVVSEVSDVTG